MSYELDRRTSIFEDELPEDLTEDEYSNWYEESWVDGVRVGPAVRRNNEEEQP